MAAHQPLSLLSRFSPSAWRRRGLDLLRLSLLCSAVLGFKHAHAQSNIDVDAMHTGLKLSHQLLERLPADAQNQAPTFVTGDVVQATGQDDVSVQGHAQLRRHDLVLNTDQLRWNEANQQLTATGHVQIVKDGNVLSGSALDLNLQTQQGHFDEPSIELGNSQAHIQAHRIDFLGPQRMQATQARYSSCPAPQGGTPDWWIQAEQLDLNEADNETLVHQGRFYFKNVPILAAPYVSLPLGKERKSGMLSPNIYLTNTSGLELTLPYYWSIAPEWDATLYPTLMTKRGIDLGAELRYLQPNAQGQLRGAFMPSDTLSQSNRWMLNWQHNIQPDTEQPSDWRFQVQRVSDDGYWKDFPRAMTSLTQRLLPSQATWSGQWNAVGLKAGLYAWQTLQDPSAIITAPYDRLPQLDATWNNNSTPMAGLDVQLQTQYARFVTQRTPSIAQAWADVNGQRWLGNLQVGKRWADAGWFVQPQIQLHAAYYQLDQAMWTGQSGKSVWVPTASFDTGLIFDRPSTWGLQAIKQTLEPRLKYVHTPYRDQSGLPLYDTAAKDFNATNAWSDNLYAGQDRMADMHTLTAGLSSRWIAQDTGFELARVYAAQRLNLNTPRVNLIGELPSANRWSDVLLGSSLQMVQNWTFENAIQLNPSTGRSQRTTWGTSYQPERYKIINTSYLLQRAGGPLPASEQLGLAWQWPMSWLDTHQTTTLPQGARPSRWYSVGRINYSMPDRKIVDLTAGFEYAADCWLTRVVFERLQRSSQSVDQRVLFQMEFNGLSSVGNNPLKTLQSFLPRSQLGQEEVTNRSRFDAYSNTPSYSTD